MLLSMLLLHKHTCPVASCASSQGAAGPGYHKVGGCQNHLAQLTLVAVALDGLRASGTQLNMEDLPEGLLPAHHFLLSTMRGRLGENPQREHPSPQCTTHLQTQVGSGAGNLIV